ncbi:hypothetical protein A2U01_0063163, partial [Trifolium medium]|nr:hypothetical protein [Trifolium medium]
MVSVATASPGDIQRHFNRKFAPYWRQLATTGDHVATSRQAPSRSSPGDSTQSR